MPEVVNPYTTEPSFLQQLGPDTIAEVAGMDWCPIFTGEHSGRHFPPAMPEGFFLVLNVEGFERVSELLTHIDPSGLSTFGSSRLSDGRTTWRPLTNVWRS